MGADNRFEDAPPKDPAESMDVELDCFPMCANFWRQNEQYQAADYVRPNRPTGFSYQATAGTSGSSEPKWPTTIGQTVIDGSITWTCAAAGANGLSAISGPTALSEPTGLTVSAVSVTETTKILATYSGGTHGYDYDVAFSFTLRGLPRVARQRVPVRRR